MQHVSNTNADSIALGTSSGDVLVYNVAAGEVNQKLVRVHLTASPYRDDITDITYCQPVSHWVLKQRVFCSSG